MPIPYERRFDMLMDPNERKHGIQLLTNDEVYRLYGYLLERLLKYKEENDKLRRELIRRGGLIPLK